MSYDNNNIFAKIIRGETDTEILYETEYSMAFYDIMPAVKTHILIIPKGKYISYQDFITQASAEEKLDIFDLIARIAAERKLDANGYRIITNMGQDATQTVMHFHIHLLAGQNMGGLFGSELR